MLYLDVERITKVIRNERKAGENNTRRRRVRDTVYVTLIRDE